jgi:NAD(P)-dependent dehydrogenase (short-subunit alcohol dehydrogenase family)
MFQPNREEITMEIAGVNSLVTGAAAGIGRETALALARAGSHVAFRAK